MKKIVALLGMTLVCVAVSVAHADKKEAKKVPPALNFTMKALNGKPVDLSDYHGKVVLIVNTASECGLTPQYEDLQALHEKYGEKGLAILGFPANEFGMQEPGSNDEIASFCKKNYGVKFQMFEKVVVKGEGQCDLYQFLTSKETNPKFSGDITWNFEKFLIGKNGEIVTRFAPRVEPTDEKVTSAIETELGK